MGSYYDDLECASRCDGASIPPRKKESSNVMYAITAKSSWGSLMSLAYADEEMLLITPDKNKAVREAKDYDSKQKKMYSIYRVREIPAGKKFRIEKCKLVWSCWDKENKRKK